MPASCIVWLHCSAICLRPANTNALTQFLVRVGVGVGVGVGGGGGGRHKIATGLRSFKTFEAMFFLYKCCIVNCNFFAV